MIASDDGIIFGEFNRPVSLAGMSCIGEVHTKVGMMRMKVVRTGGRLCTAGLAFLARGVQTDAHA